MRPIIPVRLGLRLGTAILLAAMILLAATVLPWGAAEVAADTLSISRWTVDCGGGGYSQSGTWSFAGTIGQPDAGLIQRLSYQVVGGFWGAGPLIVTGVAMADSSESGPTTARLVARVLAVRPNPTSDESRLSFELPEPRRVQIHVFSLAGALVRTVTDRVWPAGRHQLAWDGRDAGGNASAAGIYFVRVRLGSLERTQKLLVVH